jgi:hypothetical protein
MAAAWFTHDNRAPYSGLTPMIPIVTKLVQWRRNEIQGCNSVAAIDRPRG